jgi:hypothetical protein
VHKQPACTTNAAAAAGGGKVARSQQEQQQQKGGQGEGEEGGYAEVPGGVHFYALDSQDPFVLWRLQPGFVLLYDSDLSFLRQLEVYQV